MKKKKVPSGMMLLKVTKGPSHTEAKKLIDKRLGSFGDKVVASLKRGGKR